MENTIHAGDIQVDSEIAESSLHERNHTMFSKSAKKMMKLFSCFKRQGSQEETDGRRRRKMVIVGDGECGKTCLVTRMATGNFIDVGYVPTVFETEVVNVSTGEEEVELVIYDTAGQEDYDRLRPFSYNDVDVVLICFSLADTDTLCNVLENWSPEIRYFCGDAPVILVGNKKDLRDAESSLSSASSRASLSSRGNVVSEKESSLDNHQDTTVSGGVTVDDDNIPSEDVVSKKSGENVPSFFGSSKPVFRVGAPVKHSEGTSIAKRIGAMAYFETSALTGDNVEELLLATTKAAVLGTKKSRKFKPFTDTLRSWKSKATLAK